MDALPRGTAQIVTGSRGPVLPLLHRADGAEYPTYTGPLGTARLFVRRDRHLLEIAKYGMKYGAFLSADPDGKDVQEFSVSYESPEQALREVLGVYFHRAGYDSTTLAADLKRLVISELDHLEAVTT